MNTNPKKPSPRVNPVVAQAAKYVQRNKWKHTKDPRQLVLFNFSRLRKPDEHQHNSYRA